MSTQRWDAVIVGMGAVGGIIAAGTWQSGNESNRARTRAAAQDNGFQSA